MRAQTFWGIVVSIVLLLFLGTSTYTVSEGQKALVLRLGQIVENKEGQPLVKNPGFHFKIPLIDQISYFDIRMQTLDIKSSRIVTVEKKDVIVDYYTKWRISDLAKYYTSTGGDAQRAETLLEQQLNDGLRAEFGKHTINEVVSDARAQIMAVLSKQANITAKNLGVDIVDVRIKRIDLPDEVSASVFDRMRAERTRVATEHRAQGQADANVIQANADATVTVTIAKAQAEAKQVRAQGDQIAAGIYADTYQKEPQFYAFYRSMLAYRNTFNSKASILVLKPEGDFFRYFNHVAANSAKEMAKPASQTQ